MDDALQPALGLGADGYHVATAAQRHDRLADHPGQVGGMQHGVQPLAHAVLGGPHPLAQGRQLRGGRVEHLAALVDAALDPLAQCRCRVQLLAQLGQVRAVQPASRVANRSAARAVSATSSSSSAVRSPATACAADRRPHVPRAADGRLRLVVQQPHRLVGLILEQRDVGRIGHRLRRLRQLA